MSASREFVERVEQGLEELDALLDGVEAALREVRRVRAVETVGLIDAVERATGAAAALARVVREAADEHAGGARWEDRAELAALVGAIAGAIAERAAEVPRARLRAVADVLARGTLFHRTQRRRDELAALRTQAHDELLAIAAGTELPSLPGPDDADGWLAWAWALHEPEDTDTLDVLRREFPALAEFVERVEPSLWSLDGVPMVGAPFETQPVRMTPAPVAPVAPETAPPVAPEPARANDADEPVETSSLTNDAHAGLGDAGPADAGVSVAPVDELLSRSDDVGEEAPLEATVPAGANGGGEPVETASLDDAQGGASGGALATGFAVFRDAHWLMLDGSCGRAPWLEEGFLGRVDGRMARELASERFGRMWLLGAASERLGGEPLLGTAEIEAVAAIYAGPTSPFSWLAQPRGIEVAAVRATPAWRVRVFLAALRPHGEAISLDDAEALIDAVDLRSTPLRATTLGLFALRAAGADPIARMRDEIEGSADAKKLKKRVEAARKHLHAELARLRDAVEGSAAWDALAEELAAVAAPLAEAGATIDPAATWSTLVVAARRAREAIVAAPLRVQARAAADRAARRVLDAATEVGDLVRRAAAAGNRAAKGAPAPVSEARALLHALTPLARPEEELCVQLLDRQLVARERRDLGDPLDLHIADLCACPDLLALVPPVEPDAIAEGEAGRVGHVTDVEPLRAAAAILAHDEAEPSLAKVRQQLARLRREDLLGGLSAGLPPTERAWVEEARASRVERILRRCDQLDAIAADEVRRLAAERAAELALVEAWLAAR